MKESKIKQLEKKVQQLEQQLQQVGSSIDLYQDDSKNFLICDFKHNFICHLYCDYSKLFFCEIITDSKKPTFKHTKWEPSNPLAFLVIAGRPIEELCQLIYVRQLFQGDTFQIER